MKGPLESVRVLDLGERIAGPYAGMMLSDIGAEVIKVESPLGDHGRLVGGPEVDGQSFLYLAFNRNKKGITLDLWTDTGREAFFDLVRKSDVVLDNFRPGVMERLSADYNSLKKINPRIITCSISGQGASGPYTQWPSFDLLPLGISGILSITGEEGRPPVRPGAPIADLAGGLFATIGIISALFRRELTGEGQYIDISLLDCSMSLAAYHISHYFCSGIIPRPLGSGHLAILPFGVYKTKDDYITIAPSWPRLARAIGADWMIDDHRFKELDDRLKHRDEFNAVIEEHLQQMGAKEWLEIFHLEDITAGPVNNIAQATEDPQVLHRNMIVKMKYPSGGEVKQVGNPIKMSECVDDQHFTPPPTLGQHTDEVLYSILGYPKEKIDSLKREMEDHQHILEKEHVTKLG